MAIKEDVLFKDIEKHLKKSTIDSVIRDLKYANSYHLFKEDIEYNELQLILRERLEKAGMKAYHTTSGDGRYSAILKSKPVKD